VTQSDRPTAQRDPQIAQVRRRRLTITIRDHTVEQDGGLLSCSYVNIT